MSAVYSKYRAITTRLIKQYDGRSEKVTIVRRTGSVSATTGQYGSTETVASIDCIVSEYSKSTRSNEAAVSGDLMVIMTAEFIPLNGDSFIIDGKNYSVVSIITVNVGGTDLLFKARVSR